MLCTAILDIFFTSISGTMVVSAFNVNNLQLRRRLTTPSTTTFVNTNTNKFVPIISNHYCHSFHHRSSSSTTTTKMTNKNRKKISLLSTISPLSEEKAHTKQNTAQKQQQQQQQLHQLSFPITYTYDKDAIEIINKEENNLNKKRRDSESLHTT